MVGSAGLDLLLVRHKVRCYTVLIACQRPYIIQVSTDLFLLLSVSTESFRSETEADHRSSAELDLK